MTTERRQVGAPWSFTEKFRFPIWKIDRGFPFRSGCCSTVLAKVNGKTNADLCLYKQVTTPPYKGSVNTVLFAFYVV
jgi:hypothetical protein